jgi:hypothetical protein
MLAQNATQETMLTLPPFPLLRFTTTCESVTFHTDHRLGFK